MRYFTSLEMWMTGVSCNIQRMYIGNTLYLDYFHIIVEIDYIPQNN